MDKQMFSFSLRFGHGGPVVCSRDDEISLPGERPSSPRLEFPPVSKLLIRWKVSAIEAKSHRTIGIDHAPVF
jgi:hypothetical protein